MAQTTIIVGCDVTDQLTFTPSGDIRIDAITNPGSISINVSEGDEVSGGTEIKTTSEGPEYNFNPNVVIDYTSL
jgi:hypothetical protein|tara:strand:+ start:2088 stop:2309 length:222 start_codon:yes stop_codon:yes gene_type:complete